MQLSVSMRVIGSLICIQSDKLRHIDNPTFTVCIVSVEHCTVKALHPMT